MGMFDSVWAPCPHCGSMVEFQSKAGECDLATYDLTNVPADIAWDVLNSPRHCQHCDGWMALVDPAHPPTEPEKRPKPDLRPTEVRPPENPQTSTNPPSHAPRTYKWWPWDKPFTGADIIPDDEEDNAIIIDDDEPVLGKWNHRVVIDRTQREAYLSIREVYYDKNGKPQGWSEQPRPALATEDMNGLRWVLTKMLEALDKPVLDSETGEELDTETVRLALQEKPE